MNTKLKCLILALMFSCAGISVNAAPPLSYIQKAKNIVEEARFQLPVEAGYGLTLTQVQYDSKTYSLVYRYHYTIPVQKPDANSIKERKMSVVHLLKANPATEDMQLLKNGISFHYNYYSQDGTFMYAIKITPEDVK